MVSNFPRTVTATWGTRGFVDWEVRGSLIFVWAKPVQTVLNLLEDSVVVLLLGWTEKVNEFKFSCTDGLGLYLPF